MHCRLAPWLIVAAFLLPSCGRSVSPEEAEAALEQALAQAGIGVRSLTRITPSLEDAFISLIQRAGGGLT